MVIKLVVLKEYHGTSLVVQWLRIQCRGHWFNPWSRRITHAMEQLTHAPQLLSLFSGVLEPQILSLHVSTTEARTPRRLRSATGKLLPRDDYAVQLE